MARHAWWRGMTVIHVKKGCYTDLASGKKPLLIRPEGLMHLRYYAGQILAIGCGDCELLTYRVLAVRRYAGIEELVAAEPLEQIAHGNGVQTAIYLSIVFERELLDEEHDPTMDCTMAVLEVKRLSRQEALAKLHGP